MQSPSICLSTAPPYHFLFRWQQRPLLPHVETNTSPADVFNNTPPFFPHFGCVCVGRGGRFLFLPSHYFCLSAGRWSYPLQLPFLDLSDFLEDQWFCCRSSRLKDISIYLCKDSLWFRPLSLLHMDHSTGIFSISPGLSTCTGQYTFRNNYRISLRALMSKTPNFKLVQLQLQTKEHPPHTKLCKGCVLGLLTNPSCRPLLLAAASSRWLTRTSLLRRRSRGSVSGG